MPQHRWLRSLAAGFALLVLFATAAYAVSPWLAASLAPRLAPSLGLESLELEVAHPGLRKLRVHSLSAASGRMRVSATDLTLTYGLGELLGGRFDQLSVARADVVVDDPAPGSADSDSERFPAPDPGAWLDQLPLRQAEIADIGLSVPALGFAAGGRVTLDGSGLELVLRGFSPAEAERFLLTVEVARTGPVSVRLAEREGTGSPLLGIESAIDDDGLALAGQARLEGFILDLIVALSGLPAGDGRLAGTFRGRLPWPLSRPPRWNQVAAEGDLSLHWRPDAGDWAVDLPTAGWTLGDGALSGTMTGTARYADLDLGWEAVIERLVPEKVSGAGRLTLGPVHADRDAYADVRWELQDARIALQGSLTIAEALIPVLRQRFGLPEGDGRLELAFQTGLPWPLPPSAGIPGSAEGTLGGRWRTQDPDLSLSGLKGRWRFEDGRLAGRFAGQVTHGELTAAAELAVSRLELHADSAEVVGELRVGGLAPLTFELDQALDGTTGSASVKGAVAVPAPGLLGGVLQSWSGPLDLLAGRIDLDAQLGWQAPGVPDGRVRVGLAGVTARYEDYAARDLNADFQFLGRDGVWSLMPAGLTASRLVTGVPVEALSSGIAWSGDTLQVQTTIARLLGGTVRIAPFEYAIAAGAASFSVELAGVSLSQLLALEGDQIGGSGTLRGVLPVRLEANRPSVTAGSIEADPPDGIIQVSPALATATGQPGLDFALRALQDFRFTALEADVDYNVNGDLVLAVLLRGSNPAIEGGRPIHYNLNVTENVPRLLESLRLEGELTRSIERRLTN